MLDLFQYEFMQNALFAGLMIGLISPLVGIYLVVKRLSLIADALSHVTLSGIAAGLFIQKQFGLAVQPLYTGMLFAVGGSLFTEQIRKRYPSYQELAIPILLSGGIALGVVLISATDGFNVDIAGYLFGNILAVGRVELNTIFIVGGLVLIFFTLFYKEMFAVSFDEEHAILSGVRQRMIQLGFSLIVAIVIAVSMRVVGILLVSALMTLPVATSLQFCNSFKQTMFWSIVFAEFSVLMGLLGAYYLDWASGGTIVLVAIVLLLSGFLIKRLRMKFVS
ncbi:metal ABC transporter permease [Hazenella sp. IB182357]|uniref:Metal ABC transporter permease n=1 Tax=Polycladospora coralii TaxID=2771432 RepID=A0A926NEE9_9BACL|nr:metal ABC transporter permease [Polycladospora coralii]MBD1372039.1 metal ABC transporter permease [Polycladospora coralii]MBS7530545.1 metal ABC transporter permease [Polycladospora coralii]